MADYKCFDCGKTLDRVGPRPGWLSREQWDADKAGDYFAKCADATHSNGKCYFNETEGVTTLKVKRPNKATK